MQKAISKFIILQQYLIFSVFYTSFFRFLLIHQQLQFLLHQRSGEPGVVFDTQAYLTFIFGVIRSIVLVPISTLSSIHTLPDPNLFMYSPSCIKYKVNHGSEFYIRNIPSGWY